MRTIYNGRKVRIYHNYRNEDRLLGTKAEYALIHFYVAVRGSEKDITKISPGDVNLNDFPALPKKILAIFQAKKIKFTSIESGTNQEDAN